MDGELQKKIQEALANPQNMGELANADAVGTVGNTSCGEMLRMWIKFKEDRGKKVIDQATFQSFGCETAIAVASLATELIRGKTPEEALSLKTEELAGELSSALAPSTETKPADAAPRAESLVEKFTQPKSGGVKINFLKS
jgi:nitrogen fixation protein NifU and related proteins